MISSIISLLNIKRNKNNISKNNYVYNNLIIKLLDNNLLDNNDLIFIEKIEKDKLLKIIKLINTNNKILINIINDKKII
jgi:hypothetical protein